MKKLSAAFTYIFSDNEWFNKVLVGGFLLLLTPIGIGMIMINGFLDEYVSGLRRGEKAMPYWRNYRSIVHNGMRKSLLPIMILIAAYGALVYGLITVTVPSAIALFVIFLTINTVQITRSFDAVSVIVSVLLLLVAVSIGWMWIVVGWPLLIFLAVLVQAHLCTSVP
jgi:hypothetical protein